MKFGFASSVKGIRREARETAQEAARRAGLPLNEWLNAIIFQQAAEQGIAPASTRAGGTNYTDDLSKVHIRLDEFARQMAQLTRSGPAAYAPKRSREDNDQLHDLIARLEQRLGQVRDLPSSPAIPSVQLPPSLDRAITEIATRRRALNGEHIQTPPAPMPLPVPTQDLSGLESQLRQITSQIETLRRQGVEETIQAVRAELAGIGRTLNEAMPRRAIEAIEQQIRDLTRKIEEGRQAGVNGSALSGIEHGLAEVRDALHGLMPAENLVGYNEAISALTHKIDLIVAQKDPAKMQRLESSIATLREMAMHVASNETMSGLAAQVAMLADKVDHLAVDNSASDALANLEQRIDALSRTLAERPHDGDAALPRLESLVQSLSDKIDQMQRPRGDEVAFGHLEDRIARLVERLDTSDSRLGHLEAVERGLADLLVHIEDIRANKETTALRSDEKPGIDTLKHEIVRAQGAVEAMHGTLGDVVDRLTLIEKDIRAERQRPTSPGSDIVELIQTVRASPAGVGPDARESPAQPPAPNPIPASASSLSITSETPEAHQPLEPGSGPPRLDSHPAARIAASEAAVVSGRSNLSTPAGKSDFIAAARRAAQAAGQDARNRGSGSSDTPKANDTGLSLRTKVMTRVKTLFLAASIVAIVVGSIQFAGNIFDFGFFDSNGTKLTKNNDIDSAGPDTTPSTNDTRSAATVANTQAEAPPVATSAPLITATDAAALAKLFTPPANSLMPAPPPAALAPPLDLSPVAQAAPALAPAQNASPQNALPQVAAHAPKSDVTGSISRAAAGEAKTNRQSTPAAPPAPADRLPAGIGSTRLRNAALAGDAGAAYEVAMRFAEARGVPANLEEAARWFERAASKGLAPAQFRYASMLEKGQGVKKDLGAAQRLYVAAASKGHAKSMHNLAVLYAEGAEGKPDYKAAAQWFLKAAEHGVSDSQYNLGVLTARGLGTERNLAESYKWFALAAAQNDRDAGRKRDEVAAHLDAKTLAAVQQAVKNFVAEAQPQEAIVVPEPPGGWDRTTPPSSEKPKAAANPLSMTAIESGKL